MRVRRKWEGPWAWSFLLGLGCIVVGISGQAVKASEVEIGALTSGWSRFGLIAVGVLVLLASLLEPSDTGSSDSGSALPAHVHSP